MDVMLGFLAGYLLGSKLGPLEPDKISKAWASILKSKETQAFIGGAFDVARHLLRQAISRR